MNVSIESAIKLNKDQMTEIEKLVLKKYQDATFTYKVNAEILGGLRVTVGSNRIDMSLSGKLSTVSRALQE